MSEPYIVIDENRDINVPEELRERIVQFDHNVETFTFQCPRYWDSRDLSTMKIFVNYVIDPKKGTCSAYLVKELNVNEADDNMTFDWVVTQDATTKDGELIIFVCAQLTDELGNLQHHWSSNFNKDFKLAKSYKCLQGIVDNYPNIIGQMLADIDKLKENGGSVTFTYNEATGDVTFGNETVIAAPEGIEAHTEVVSINGRGLQDAVAREKISELSEEKVDKAGITLGQHTDGLIYIFVDGEPVGNGFLIGQNNTSDNPSTDVPVVVLPDYKNITFTQEAYTVGRTSTQYNGWIPHNLQYDEVNDKFLLLGCHRSGHAGAYSNITLTELDPTDPTAQTEINVPTYKALGSLLVDDGVWYIYKYDGSGRYVSNDMGNTWTEETTTIQTNAGCFGAFKVNGKYFIAADSYWNTYYVSDDGVNFEVVTFSDNNTEEKEGKEGGFAYFNGYYYAFLRSDTIQYARVYKSETAESGTWTLVDEETIPSYQTCPMPIVYKDRICCVTTNRGDGHLYYCFLDEKDSIEVNDMGLRSTNPSNYGDFITANIAYDGEHAIIAYCTMSLFDGVSATNYLVCETVALYGKVGTENNIPSIVESLESVTAQQSGNADLTTLGVTLYPDGATLADGSIQSSVTNNNDYDVFGVFNENPINKMFLTNATSIRSYGAFYPIKNGKIALPSAEWGSMITPSANFNANQTYDWMQCIEINGKLYLWCNKNGEKTLLRRDSFVYGATLEGCPNYDDLRKMLYVPAGATEKYVLRNVNFIETITRS